MRSFGLNDALMLVYAFAGAYCDTMLVHASCILHNGRGYPFIAQKNSIDRLRPVEAFASLLPACSSMKWDNDIYSRLCDSITKVIATTPIYALHCLPDEEAAWVCHISKGHFVLHRIVSIGGENVTLRGDGNINTESCRMKDIRAMATAFFRKGRSKPDKTSGLKWRIYSWWWTRMLPIRRYLLFALHPHIPQRLLKKGSKKGVKRSRKE